MLAPPDCSMTPLLSVQRPSWTWSTVKDTAQTQRPTIINIYYVAHFVSYRAYPLLTGCYCSCRDNRIAPHFWFCCFLWRRELSAGIWMTLHHLHTCTCRYVAHWWKQSIWQLLNTKEINKSYFSSKSNLCCIQWLTIPCNIMSLEVVSLWWSTFFNK